jgi:MarR family transcriptional regulator, 2-MHQ and catechol-resistance regulon repressor
LPLDQRCVKICLDVKVDVTKRKKDSEAASEHSRSAKDRSKATHVWLVLWKASHAVERQARASVAQLELGLTDFAVLEMLLHKGPQPVNTIGKRVLLTSGSITTAIDRLESRGLVHRMPHPEDQRTRMVHLTGEGRRVIQRAFQLHARDMEETVKVLNSKERIELVRLLKKLGRYAEAKRQ